MKIIEINTMKGPNYWSIRRHNLTVMVLDLEELEQFPTILIAIPHTFTQKPSTGHGFSLKQFPMQPKAFYSSSQDIFI